MTLHFHALPITPNAELYTLAGRNFLVSFGTSAKAQADIADRIGQVVWYDNGAFSRFQRLKKDIAARRLSGERISDDDEYELVHAPVDWRGFYGWVDARLDRPTSRAIVPDVIEGASQHQDSLLKEWPFGHRGIPVFHIHHNTERLLRLVDEWPIVALGSTAEFWEVLSDPWVKRMDHLFNEVVKRHSRLPWLHMLRGMQLVLAGNPWPFASVDSSDIGRNCNRPQNTARAMADRWDAAQCPPEWLGREPHPDLFEGRAA